MRWYYSTQIIVIAAALLASPPASRSQDRGPAVLEGVRYADAFAGADIGAQIDTAIASLPEGGEVVVPAGHYEFSTTISIDRPVRLIGQGAGNTVLTYSGGGSAVSVEIGVQPPYLAGSISDLTLQTGGEATTAVGIREVDTDGFSYSDLVIEHFAVGIWMDNESTDYCGQCQAGFSERTEWSRISFFENRVGLEFTNNGGLNSFEYSWMAGCHFQVNNGQVGIWLDGSGEQMAIYLGHSDMEFMANVCLSDATGPAGTVAEATGGAFWTDGFIHATAEQSCGANPSIMWAVGPGSEISAWGQVFASGLVDDVDPTGSLYIGLDSSDDGTGPVVRSSSPTLSSPSLSDAILNGASVPLGSTLAIAGELDASGAAVSLPARLDAGGDQIVFPAGGGALVTRDSTEIMQNKTLDAPVLKLPTVGGEQMTYPSHATFAVFIPGPLNHPAAVATWTPDHAVWLTRIQATAFVAPEGCPDAAVLTVSQGGTVASLSLPNTYDDSGPLRVPLDGGAAVTISISSGAKCVKRVFCARCPRPGPSLAGARQRKAASPPRTGSWLFVRGAPPADVNLLIQYVTQ